MDFVNGQLDVDNVENWYINQYLLPKKTTQYIPGNFNNDIENILNKEKTEYLDELKNNGNKYKHNFGNVIIEIHKHKYNVNRSDEYSEETYSTTTETENERNKTKINYEGDEDYIEYKFTKNKKTLN